MVGLIKDNNKVPFISLADFIDNDKLNAAKQELAAYKEKQDNYYFRIFHITSQNVTSFLSIYFMMAGERRIEFE
jgi:hypothetical protein